MTFLIAFLLSLTPITQDAVFETDHYVINNTNSDVVISVDYKDQADNPGQGSSMYSIPPGAAMIVSQWTDPQIFMGPTEKFTYTLLTAGLNVDLNAADTWLFEKVSDHKGRYQFTIEQD